MLMPVGTSIPLLNPWMMRRTTMDSADHATPDNADPAANKASDPM
jgi:hypothetical protein